MHDAEGIRQQKRRSNRAVVAGVTSVAMALLVSMLGVLPPLVTTVAALGGFAFIMYGVHVGWMVFYDREPDGPAS